MLPLTTTFLDGDAMRPFDFVVTEGLVSAGLDRTERQRVHPHTAPPGTHMDAHQFVAELVLMGGSRTEREEGRGEERRGNDGGDDRCSPRTRRSRGPGALKEE
jgi:hypothetical protein